MAIEGQQYFPRLCSGTTSSLYWDQEDGMSLLKMCPISLLLGSLVAEDGGRRSVLGTFYVII